MWVNFLQSSCKSPIAQVPRTRIDRASTSSSIFFRARAGRVPCARTRASCTSYVVCSTISVISSLRRLGRWVLVVGFVIVVFSLPGQCLPDRLLFQEGQFGRL